LLRDRIPHILQGAGGGVKKRNEEEGQKKKKKTASLCPFEVFFSLFYFGVDAHNKGT